MNFIMININEILKIKNILEKKKKSKEIYMDVVRDQVHQVFLSYMTNHTQEVG